MWPVGHEFDMVGLNIWGKTFSWNSQIIWAKIIPYPKKVTNFGTISLRYISLYATEKAFAKKINDINMIIRPVFKLMKKTTT